MSKTKKLKKRQMEAEKAAHKARLRKIRIISAAVTASVLAVAIIISAVMLALYNKKMNEGEYLREKVAAASKKFEVNGAEMSYFFNDTYNTFVSYYGSYIQYFGIDTETSLKTQYYTDGESWFDYFMDGTRSTVEKMLALSEAGVDFGCSIKNDAQMLAIYNRAQRMDEGLYGRGVNKQDIFEAKTIEATAYICQFEKERELEPTDAEVLQKYESDPKVYQLADYYSFPVYYSTGDNESKLPSREDAETVARKLASAKTSDEFKAYVWDVLANENADITKAELTQKISALETVGQHYKADDELSDWAFGAVSGDTIVLESEEDSAFTVYYLTKAPYRDETGTVSARHILFSDSAYGSREAALEAAERVLGIFNSGDGTAEEFALLALEYSEDAGSYYNGGLYERMHKGQMVDAFDAWCFDEKRVSGDIGIIETEYGCHIMYFEGKSCARWEADVRYDMVNERFEAYLDEIMEKYPVLFDETVIDMIPG